MDRLDAMSVLLAAVEAGSLSAASRRLGMPLATVSRKVAELEEHLKARLLIRAPRQFALTDAGRSYVAACKTILEQVGEAEKAAAGEYANPRGDLTITAPVAFGRLHLLPVVADFLQVYPEIDVRLSFSDRFVQLLEEHVDLALRIGDLPDSTLRASRLGTIRQVTCASPAYLAQHGTPCIPADLSGYDCINLEIIHTNDRWMFGAEAVAIQPRLRVNTAEAAVDAACLGLGITRVLSYQAAQSLADGRLMRLLTDHEPPPRPVSLVYAAQGLLPLKLRAFLDFATPRLKARLAGETP
ncbi:LysR family transcriptional regulator [Lacibacterium aquatile]|uniref:LysR family transcriptional regulator n=1 Tax=Lacibacterium aquatile TaxID=1168082 RepID=A0ABW5DKS5_9PROT